MKISVLGILQARFNSSRLPGKVLKPILGKAMLAHQIERLQQTHLLNKIIVATSTHSADDNIEKLCDSMGVECFRGQLNNVLDRYYQVAKIYQPEHIVRVTGDCPLIDSDIVDQVIDLHLHSNADYTSNCNPPTLPDGLDVEVFNFAALKTAWLNSKKPSEKEHVTPYIRNNHHLFQLQNFNYPQDLSQYRWTVDEPEDFELINIIYQELYPKNPYFKLNDILKLLKIKPELSNINQNFERNEGLQASLEQDKELGFE